jgi:predicted MFS family arabinose efflux permease
MTTSNLSNRFNRGLAALSQGGMSVFLLVWFGQIISLIGSGMTCFAQSITVYTDLGGSIANLGILAILAQLPGILLSPIAGVLADRYDRRWMMIACDTVAALATLTLRLLIMSGMYQIWHIYVIVVIISIANHFQWPAYFAAISTLVSKEKLGQANGLVAAGRAVGQVIAPLVAGYAVLHFKLQGVILFDFATYLFATTTLLLVRFPKPQATPEVKTSRGFLWRETMYGMNYIFSRPGLIGTVTLVSVGNFVLGAIGVLMMPIALSMVTPDIYGNLVAAGGVCLLLGGLVMGLWGGPKRRVDGMLLFMILQGVAILLAGIFPVFGLLALAICIFHFATSIVDACGMVLWQSKIPANLQGRALAASALFTAGAMELGILLIIFIADPIENLFIGGSAPAFLTSLFGMGDGRGCAFLFSLFGLLYIGVAIAGFFYPRIRFMESELPDMLTNLSPAPVEGIGAPIPATAAVYEMSFDASVPAGRDRE